jgi:hypothetical protein
LRNNVPGALDAHPVTNAQAEPLDLVAVVQRHVGDDHSADADGRQAPDGRQLAGAPDLDVDRFQRRLRLLRRKLVREAPARGSRDEAQPLLQVEPVDLVDDAVDIEREVSPRLLDRAIVREHSVHVVAADEQLGDGNPEALNPLHRFILRVGERFAELTPPVSEKAQRTGRGDAGILLPKRAGRGVARIGKHLAAGRFLSLVERFEVGFGHVDLAAHFKDVGRAGNVVRDIADGANIGRHVLADSAIAARRREHQRPLLVAERAAEPVDLRLGSHRDGCLRRQVQEPLHASDELTHVLRRERVFEAEHRPCMSDLGETAGGRRAQSLRRRIRSHKLREARLKLAVLAHQRVIFRVGNLRRILVVIKFVVPRNFLRQPHQPVGGIRVAQSINVRQGLPRAGSRSLSTTARRRGRCSGPRRSAGRWHWGS